MTTPLRISLTLTLFTLLLGSSLATADQTSSRLPPLFEHLQAAKSPLEAQMLEQMIWEVWIEHGDEAIQQQMSEAASFMNQQDYAAALAVLDQVVEQAPDYAEGWNRRATVRFLVKDYEGSIADIDRTLALEPRHFGALSGLGQIYLLQQRPVEALGAFDQALEANPNMSAVQELRDRLEQRIKQQAI